MLSKILVGAVAATALVSLAPPAQSETLQQVTSTCPYVTATNTPGVEVAYKAAYEAAYTASRDIRWTSPYANYLRMGYSTERIANQIAYTTYRNWVATPGSGVVWDSYANYQSGPMLSCVAKGANDQVTVALQAEFATAWDAVYDAHPEVPKVAPPFDQYKTAYDIYLYSYIPWAPHGSTPAINVRYEAARAGYIAVGAMIPTKADGSVFLDANGNSIPWMGNVTGWQVKATVAPTPRDCGTETVNTCGYIRYYRVGGTLIPTTRSPGAVTFHAYRDSLGRTYRYWR